MHDFSSSRFTHFKIKITDPDQANFELANKIHNSGLR